jgi:hypothetical protein
MRNTGPPLSEAGRGAIEALRQEISVPDTYEIRVVGALGRAGHNAFADLAVDVEPTVTVLSGEMSQETLHEVLDRVRALGLELVDVRLVPSRPSGA